MHMKLYTYMYSVLCTHNLIVPTKVHIHALAIMETSAPVKQIVCFQEAAAARVCTLGHYRK